MATARCYNAPQTLSPDSRMLGAGSIMATAWHYSAIEESDDDLNALLDNIEDPSDVRMSNERLLQVRSSIL